MMLSRKQGKVIRKTALYCIIISLVVFVDFPMIWMVISSVKPSSELFSSPPVILPTRLTLEHYTAILTVGNIPTYYKNSIIVGSICTFITLALAIYGAYILSRFRFRGAGVLAKMILLFYMLPDILLAIPFFVMLVNINLNNTYLGLSLAHTSLALPFALWLSWGYLKSIPIELDEAAMIDGASRLGVLWHVLLPCALPGIAAIGVFTFLTSWNEYTFAMILMADDSMKTLPAGIGMLTSEKGVWWGMLMASGSLATIPLIPFYALVLKYLVRGITAGAVKF